MTTVPISLRQALADDLAFFFSATLQSHFYSSYTNRQLAPAVYYREHKAVLEGLLKRPSVRLGIACLKEDPAVIIGYALAEPLSNTLHYVYVKRAFRQFGIARRLVAFMDIDLPNCEASHWTDDLGAICHRKKYTNLVFNPYLLME